MKRDLMTELNQEVNKLAPTTSPNNTKEIKIILATSDDNEKYKFEGIQSQLHYVNYDTNLVELAKIMNNELMIEENKKLGDKSTLIRRFFVKEICEICGIETGFRLVNVSTPRMTDFATEYPCFAYASVAIE